eukprot:m.508902 g.508902  ORF g.508902 m.508902 type:complete len:401 (+) comp21888_c1_seq2:159-1361(+)
MGDFSNIHISAGSYGHVLYGFELKISNEAEKEMRIEPKYAYEAHMGSITSVAVKKDCLVSGSVDETIKIYNLRKKVEHGTLMEHQGTITCLAFVGDAHMLSAAEDGSIMVWDTASWNCLKVLRGHGGSAIDGISVHPSGRLALSVGRDRTLHVWNLIKGRKAFVSKLKGLSRLVRWFPDGNAYAVVVGASILVYATDTGEVEQTLQLPAPVHALDFACGGKILIVGTNSENVHCIDRITGEVVHTLDKAHEARVRHVTVIDGRTNGDGDANSGASVVVTSSTDGVIKVWNVMWASTADGAAATSECVAQYETGARLTCMAACDVSTPVHDSHTQSRSAAASAKHTTKNIQGTPLQDTSGTPDNSRGGKQRTGRPPAATKAQPSRPRRSRKRKSHPSPAEA